MPMYEYVSEDGETKTIICKYEERPKQIIEDTKTYYLNHCPGILRPNEENKFGVNGTYDQALGATYTNYKERDRICQEKNVAPVSSKEIWDGIQTAKNIRAKQDKQIDAHQKAVDAQINKKESYLKVYNSELNK